MLPHARAALNQKMMLYTTRNRILSPRCVLFTTMWQLLRRTVSNFSLAAGAEKLPLRAGAMPPEPSAQVVMGKPQPTIPRCIVPTNQLTVPSTSAMAASTWLEYQRRHIITPPWTTDVAGSPQIHSPQQRMILATRRVGFFRTDEASVKVSVLQRPERVTHPARLDEEKPEQNTEGGSEAQGHHRRHFVIMPISPQRLYRPHASRQKAQHHGLRSVWRNYGLRVDGSLRISRAMMIGTTIAA